MFGRMISDESLLFKVFISSCNFSVIDCIAFNLLKLQLKNIVNKYSIFLLKMAPFSSMPFQSYHRRVKKLQHIFPVRKYHQINKYVNSKKDYIIFAICYLKACLLLLFHRYVYLVFQSK